MGDEATRLKEALRGTALFAQLPDESIDHLAAQMRSEEYPAGEAVVEEDTIGRIGRMFVMLSGSARAEVDGAMVAEYGAGDYFGEMSLLDEGPRSATVVAATDVEVGALSSSDLRATIKQYPSVAIHLIEVLAGRLRATNEQLAAD